MASVTELTPQERLAISRKAIFKHMNRHHREARDGAGEEEDPSIADEPRSSAYTALHVIKHAVKLWWHRNPASAAVELAHPLLSDYAKSHPYKLLAVSAGIGAASVVIRPWRMVSVGTLLVGAIKSSGLTSALISLLYSFSPRSGNAEPKP